MLKKIIRFAWQSAVKCFEDFAELCVDAESLLPIQYYYDLSEMHCGQM